MKKFFFSLVALMIATVSYSQSKLVATLTHGNKVTMYYGSDAFKDAFETAKSGDVIMLSGGKFNGTDITKAVTIRGEGIDAQTPTTIGMSWGDMKVEIPQTDSQILSVEGVNFISTIALLKSSTKPYFLKCGFESVSFDGYGFDMNRITSTIKDVLFVNCKINSFYLKGSTNAMLYNSYVVDYTNYDYDNPSAISKATFVNCVYSGSYGQCYRSSFINCIFTNSFGSLPSETAVMNCAASDNNVFSNMQGSEISCYYYGYGNIFKNDQFYELIDDAKSVYLGTDGTEIGLYGGSCPYSSIPNYPRITKLEVAKQTTADNKLSVDIEVSAAQ